MLLVIFGAGASFDSIPGAPDHQGGIFHRPPLAANLFDDRDNFKRALLDFKDAIPLVMELDRRMKRDDGAVLERELERFQAEARTYPARLRQLAAVRFYLQAILWECSVQWQQRAYGKTNYVEFLRRVDQWRYAHEEVVAFVTFNYDTLLDSAYSAVFGRSLESVDAYLEDASIPLFKVHGSVNWGRLMIGPIWSGVTWASSDSAANEARSKVRNRMIQQIAHNLPSDSYELFPSLRHPVSLNGTPLFPAVAIPFSTKSSFECPSHHLRELDRLLEGYIDRIIMVGWRGNDMHFLERLKKIPAKAPRVQIVGWDEEGLEWTKRHLSWTGLDDSKMETVENGFSNYLQEDLLEEFLTKPVAR